MLKNPLSYVDASDPFITYDNKLGYYYHLVSCQGESLYMRRSRKLEDLFKDEKKEIFKCPEEGNVHGPMWAPEMYKIDKNWYIYTSCAQKYNENNFAEIKHLLILKSKTEDPYDGFEFGSNPDMDIFAIDPTSSFIDGKQYISYSEVDKVDHLQKVMIREMKDPLTFTDNVAEVTRATLDWEKAIGYDIHTINEGSFFLKRNKRLFIIYSANGCWSDDYCLGVMEYTGGDLCDKRNWKKHDKPLFTKGNGVYGPGHASFFTSPDGSETWCAYHCLLKSDPLRVPMDRPTCVQKISFDENDYPVMGHPLPIETEMIAPKGE